TALVLATCPRLVRRRLARRLPAHWIDVRGALDTCTTFGEMDASGRGYFGWPAAARAVTGRRALALRARLLARALLAELGAPPMKPTHPTDWSSGASVRHAGAVVIVGTHSASPRAAAIARSASSGFMAITRSPGRRAPRPAPGVFARGGSIPG